MNVKKMGVLFGACALTFTLAACSTSSPEDTAISATVTEEGMPSEGMGDVITEGSGTLIGGDPGTWSPIMVTQADNGKTFDLVIGQVGIFNEVPDSNTPDNYYIVSSDVNVVEGMQRMRADDMVGFVAVGEGQAKVTVYNGFIGDDKSDVVLKEITVNVSAQTTEGSVVDGVTENDM
jgi:hypothetical protein